MRVVCEYGLSARNKIMCIPMCCQKATLFWPKLSMLALWTKFSSMGRISYVVHIVQSVRFVEAKVDYNVAYLEYMLCNTIQ